MNAARQEGMRDGAFVAWALAGTANMRFLTAHYLAPMELGLYFPAALMVVAAGQRAFARGASEGGTRSEGGERV